MGLKTGVCKKLSEETGGGKPCRVLQLTGGELEPNNKICIKL
jgi:hypothetical protein